MKAIGLVISWEEWRAGRSARNAASRVFGEPRRKVNPGFEKAQRRLQRLGERDVEGQQAPRSAVR